MWYRWQGKPLIIADPNQTLPDGLGDYFTFRKTYWVDFKWTDNCYEKGDWTDFTLNGDAAPNDRFNYRANW